MDELPSLTAIANYVEEFFSSGVAIHEHLRKWEVEVQKMQERIDLLQATVDEHENIAQDLRDQLALAEDGVSL
jgi:predicted DNA-binding protein YlxM (UPF0122 family)